MKMLDCFCGLGGVSDGFTLEGFDVLGIDIENMPSKGYKHSFQQADIRELDGADYQGYDVIWGSPPCRDFTQLGIVYGKSWKKKRDPERGKALVNAFLKWKLGVFVHGEKDCSCGASLLIADDMRSVNIYWLNKREMQTVSSEKLKEVEK